MKKFFAIAVIAIAFVACNNDAEKKDTVTDSVVNVIDSTANAAKDSMSTIVDDATKMVDSTANAVVDSVKSKM